MRRFILVVILALTTLPLYAQSSGAAHIPLPADLTGTLNGAEYRIRVPANWNGTLLMWAHGSASASVEVAPPAYPPISASLDDHLLSLGYALAGSLYPDSEKDGPLRTLALNNFFKGMVGNPQRTIVWGMSLGGGTALGSIESYPAIYDGAIAISAPAAGRAKDADFTLRYDLAYAAAFGWPSESWGPVEDLRDDLYGNEGTLIIPVFQWPWAGNYGQWEFIRLVMKESTTAWWEVDPSVGLPGLAFAGWKAISYRSHLEQLCGGPVAQNIGVVYTLSDEEKAYLATLGVKADELLAWMNAQSKIAARRSARNHVQQYGTPTGNLRQPLITVHGKFDPLLPASHEAVYRSLAEAAGKGDLLVQAYVNTGHASFSAEQFLAALNAMENWLDTGIRPNASFFPENMGFDNSFVPPPWPY